MGLTRSSGLDPPGVRCAEAPRLIRQADPELYSIVFALRGELEVTQLGRDATSGAHDLALCDSSRPMTPKPSSVPCRISLPGSLWGSRPH
ncbi:hypothetical protein [Streptomyces sp. 061-3]|uniref:AraC-like ligand-binding domain-containing protein n=1 Tax=Streptomyces sp. 061-3 TaxID=2789268 RepID=UPI0039818483